MPHPPTAPLRRTDDPEYHLSATLPSRTPRLPVANAIALVEESSAQRPRIVIAPRHQAMIAGLVALGVYWVIHLSTAANFTGNVDLYADQIAAAQRGGFAQLFEFSHLLWRSVGFAAVSIIPARFVGGDVGVLLAAISTTCGAIAVAAFVSWGLRLGASTARIAVAAACMCLANGFMSFSQTGLAFVPALAALIVGLRQLAGDESTPELWTIASAAGCFALSVLLWFPMALGVPAAAASVLIFRGDSPRGRQLLIGSALLSALLVVIAYAMVSAYLGVHSIASFTAWASFGAVPAGSAGGVKRAVFGLFRSFVLQDRLGVITKRYLFGDPYNPASLGDIVQAGFGLLAVFYLLLGAMAAALARHARGRRALLFLALTLVPVVAFAIAGQGGESERYLALYPALFIAFAVTLEITPRGASRATVLAVAALLAIVNGSAMSRRRMADRCAALAARLPEHNETSAGTVVFTPMLTDDLTAAGGLCPSYQNVVTQRLNIIGLAVPNAVSPREWHARFANLTEDAWRKGGRAYVSRALLANAPASGSDWVEGDGPALRWKDFPTFFSQLDLGASIGGPDGLVELLPTPRARGIIANAR